MHTCTKIYGIVYAVTLFMQKFYINFQFTKSFYSFIKIYGIRALYMYYSLCIMQQIKIKLLKKIKKVMVQLEVVIFVFA